MAFGLPIAATIQFFFVIIFFIILIPLRIPQRKSIPIIGSVILILFVLTWIFANKYGLEFMHQYGYLYISLPLYTTVYIFSKSKGFGFIFVMMTILIFHRIISILLTVIRIYSGGYTFIYFLMNFLMFGLLLYGAWRLRTDFHKIVFTYQKEFSFLTVILLLLLIFVCVFSPFTEYNKVDTDLLLCAMMIYLLILMFYIYIGVSFQNFSRRLESERNTLSLQHQMQAAQEHIKLIQTSQEKTKQYRHDLRHHLLLINEFLDNNKIQELKNYLIQVKKDIDTITPMCYCLNETANLILASFSTQAQKLGITLELDARIPPSLSISNTEICTLLSNALENAITATSNVNDGREKLIRLNASMLDGKLLLLVENPYIDTIHMENGFPQSNCIGHGFGTKSMQAIAEKYGGLSCFEAHDGIFTVRIVA